MCTAPVRLRVKYFDSYTWISVPCGKCCECLKQYQNSWLCRLYEEITNQFVQGKGVIFGTLTYNNDSVPYFVNSDTGETYLTVCKKNVQDWIKRFRTYRKRQGLSTDFKYFLTSEYGPRTLRPHYHLLIFGLSYFDCKPLFDDWKKHFGYVKYNQVLPTDNFSNSAMYVSKYCSKGMFENPLVSQKKVSKTFHLISKGIGISYVSRMKDFHLSRSLFPSDESFVRCRFGRRPGSAVSFTKRFDKYLTYLESVYKRKVFVIPTNSGNISYKLPRYYVDKIFGSKTNLSFALSNFVFLRSQSLYDSKLDFILSSHPNWSRSQAIYFLDMQNDCDVEHREAFAFECLAKFYDKKCKIPVI